MIKKDLENRILVLDGAMGTMIQKHKLSESDFRGSRFANHTVDVKGNNLPDEIWVEFKNVKGKDGWLYGGATIIAFDMPEEGGFAIVDRGELAFFCEKHVKNEKVTHKRDAYLKRYTRKDRKDVISILKLHDLKSLTSYRVWKYDQKY